MQSEPLGAPSAQLEARFRFSQASLQDFEDCARRFQLRYLDRLTWPAMEAGPATIFDRRQQDGMEFHRLVHQHLLGVAADALARSIASPDVQRWWEHYHHADLSLSGYTQYPEATLSARIGDHRILAKYDLVATNDGKVVIYDWKTYARRPSDSWLQARWQTRVYQALLVRAGAAVNNGLPFDPRNVRMVYWFAEFPDEPAEFRYDEGRYRRDLAAIEGMVQRISDTTVFPLTENARLCRLCQYRSLCGRGDVAGSWKDVEVEIPEVAVSAADTEQLGPPEI